MSAIPGPWRQGMAAFDVLAASRMTPAELAALRDARLASLLTAVVEGSALYRAALDGRDPATMPLAALPPVGKAQLMQRFADWVTDPRLRLDELRAFTADRERIGEPFLDTYTVWESSGSSGEPGLFVQDDAVLAVYDALESVRRDSPRPWRRLIDPMFASERIAFVGAIGGHFASHVSVQRLRRINPWLAAPWRSFSILQPAAGLVAELNAFMPSIVATYPTAAGLLAEEAERGRLRIAPLEVWTGGETLTQAVRARVQRAFGCALRNSYGASEFLPIAWECSQGRLHANTDWLILEPVDARGRPVPPGQRPHTTLLTNLANRVQPIIRYDLGDQVTLFGEPCPCGSPLPVIEVLGRRDDVLRMAGRDGQPVALLPLALATVLEEDAGVFDFQLEQCAANALLLRLGPAGAAQAERCRQALLEFAAQHGLARVHLRVIEAPPLARGRGGKVARVLAMRPR